MKHFSEKKSVMNEEIHSPELLKEMNNRKNSSDKEKDEGYWQCRKQNNMAAKKCRKTHKAKIDETEKKADMLEKRNKNMSEEISMIREESLMLKKLLEKYEPSNFGSEIDQLESLISKFASKSQEVFVDRNFSFR